MLCPRIRLLYPLRLLKNDAPFNYPLMRNLRAFMLSQTLFHKISTNPNNINIFRHNLYIPLPLTISMLSAQCGRLHLNCRPCATPSSRFKGLMFSKTLKDHQALLFIFPTPRKIDIHMLFVFQTIDTAWLDKQGKILQIKRHLKPFTPLIKGAFATYLLETRAGATLPLRV